MLLCTLPECQTTAGCRCGRGFAAPKSLADYSDAEIAQEYHRRALRQLGDQTKTVSVPPGLCTPRSK